MRLATPIIRVQPCDRHQSLPSSISTCCTLSRSVLVSPVFLPTNNHPHLILKPKASLFFLVIDCLKMDLISYLVLCIYCVPPKLFISGYRHLILDSFIKKKKKGFFLTPMIRTSRTMNWKRSMVNSKPLIYCSWIKPLAPSAAIMFPCFQRTASFGSKNM